MTTILDSSRSEDASAGHTSNILGMLAHLASSPVSARAENLDKISWHFSKNPVIEIQKAGRQIASHFGLEHLMFVIIVRDHPQDVAGRVHLNSKDRLVEIELSRDTLRFEAAVLAVLCHEIMHKFLAVHGLEYAETNANERLTDTAAVFFGLGAFMLEGAFCTKETWVSSSRQIESMRIGYLTPEEFARAYIFSSKETVPLRSASGHVRRCISREKKFLETDKYRSNDKPSTVSFLIGHIKERVELLQREDLLFRLFLDCHRDGIKPDSRNAARTYHRTLHRIRKRLATIYLNQETPVNYYRACELLADVKRIENGHAGEIQSGLRYRAWRLFGYRELATIPCPACKQSLRVKSTTYAMAIRCPMCKYEFPAITSWKAPLYRLVSLFRRTPDKT